MSRLMGIILVCCLSHMVTVAEEVLTIFGKPVHLADSLKSAPHLDGKLSDAIWKDVPELSLLSMLNAKISKYYKTSVKILASKDDVYFAIECEEPRLAQINLNKLDRDSNIDKEDHLEFCLFPEETKAHHAIFKVSIGGTMVDILDEDLGYQQSGFEAMVHHGKNSWTAEIKINYTELLKKWKVKTTSHFRFNFFRHRMDYGWDDFERSCFAAVPYASRYEGSLAGYLYLASLGQKIPEQAQKVKVNVAAFSHNNLVALKIPLLMNEMTIDGDLKDLIQNGAALVDMKMLDGSGKLVENETKTWLGVSKEGLYVGMRNFDSQMNTLKTAERIRDNATWNDDSVELFIKVGENADKEYYHICVNADGSIYDSFNDSVKWNANDIKTATKKESSYWDIEIFIPFDNLDAEAIKKAKGKPWRFNVIRVRPPHSSSDTLEESAWSPTNSSKSHIPNRFGYLFMPEEKKETEEK